MNAVPKMQVIGLHDFRQKQQSSRKAYNDGDRALNMKEVIEKIGVSRSTINRWIKEGEFVPKRYFGSRSIRFLESDVDAWMRAKDGSHNER